jgi:hypothetical protein
VRGALLGGILGAALALLLLAPGSAVATPSLLTGFTDTDAYLRADGPDRAAALANTRRARGSIARVVVSWADIAPMPPPSPAAAADPAWEGYSWDQLDSAVRDIAASGLRPLINFYRAPPWAEGGGRPPVSERVPSGTWKPSVQAYGRFSRAAAERYSGRFPDPGRPGRPLPRVRYWQAWNEPNLSTYLNPQWRRRGGRFVPASPTLYRHLLNSFYRGVKSASRGNRVISGGTSPFGDPWRGGRRIPPALFTRAWLCLSGARRLRPVRCSGSPSRFDAIAHHPYAVFSPLVSAQNRDDVKMADIRRKLVRPLRAAIRAHKVSRRHGLQVWATEFSWDTRPPDPDGLSLGRHARYIQAGLYTLWRQGVDVALNFKLRDDPRGSAWKVTFQSGPFFRGPSAAADTPKPALTAFRFPFTAYRRRGVATLWGLAPGAGTVTVESRRGPRWRRVVRLRAGRNRVFVARRRIRKGTLLRARMGRDTSMDFRVGPSEAPKPRP